MEESTATPLMGRFVKIIAIGGTISGRIVGAQKDRLILEDENGDLSIIFKDKISIMSIIKDIDYLRYLKIKLEKEAGTGSQYNLSTEEELQREGLNLPRSRVARSGRKAGLFVDTEENDVGAHNNYGSILPEDILVDLDGEGSLQESLDEDLSCSFSDKGLGSRIEFRVKDDTKKKT